MAFNVPNGNKGNISFGPAILRLGPTGVTPITEVGFSRTGAVLTVSRTPLDLNQGMPEVLVCRFTVAELVSLQFTGLEFSLTNIQSGLGAGEITGDELGFGGDPGVATKAVRMEHRSPTGATYFVDLFHATREGDFTWTFQNDFHELPFQFRALETSSDWSGATLPEKERLFRITRIG